MPATDWSLRYQTLHMRGQNHPLGVAVEATHALTEAARIGEAGL
jgi:hypothetical protein